MTIRTLEGPSSGFNYLQLFGQVREEDWPYTSGSGQDGDCQYDLHSLPPAVGLTGYDSLPRNDPEAVMTHLAEVGPLAVGVFASGWSGYSGGVYEGCSYQGSSSINDDDDDD